MFLNSRRIKGLKTIFFQLEIKWKTFSVVKVFDIKVLLQSWLRIFYKLQHDIGFLPACQMSISLQNTRRNHQHEVFESKVISFQLSLSFQSLTILASIPAAILILSLFFLLLYLMTRCCDRKSKKLRTFGCQKCTLIFITILCCGAIGGGTCTHNQGSTRTIGSGWESTILIFNFIFPSLFLVCPCFPPNRIVWKRWPA